MSCQGLFIKFQVLTLGWQKGMDLVKLQSLQIEKSMRSLYRGSTVSMSSEIIYCYPGDFQADICH